jgi:hypothetical protein
LSSYRLKHVIIGEIPNFTNEGLVYCGTKLGVFKKPCVFHIMMSGIFQGTNQIGCCFVLMLC